MEKILVSACLVGQPVRYDGRDNLLQNELLHKWQQESRLVVICPEVSGGLSVPRPACEIDTQSGRILTKDGIDMTPAFEAGAQAALALVKDHQIRFALLKERSPSCGVHEIYDGSFSKQRLAGQGRTSALLQAHGVQVYSEDDISLLRHDLEKEEGC